MLTHTFWQLAQIGAEWVLYVLVILSVSSIALMVERGIYFYKQRADIDIMQKHLRRLLSTGGAPLALKQFSRIKGVPVAILRDTLEVAHQGPHAAEEVSIGSRGKHKNELERGLIFLGTLGNNAPFIGLFGTVLGIINSFRDLSGTQLQQASTRIMGNISEALVATAVGLLVAIPAVIAFNIFQRRVKKILAESDILIREVLAYLHGQDRQATLPQTDINESGKGDHNG
jgi:biopolymer transport protein ExbB